MDVIFFDLNLDPVLYGLYVNRNNHNADGKPSNHSDKMYFKSVTNGEKAKIEYEDEQYHMAYMFEMGNKFEFYNRAISK